jgi:hypothetical protein
VIKVERKIATSVASLGLLALLSLPSVGFADAFTYQGRILDPGGRPVEGATVQFKLRITNPDLTCVIYAENFDVDMRGGNGMFSLAVGNGPRTDSGTRPFTELMAPNLSLAATTDCPGGYNRAAGEMLMIQMSFNDGTGAEQTMNPLQINPVPMAIDTLQIAGVSSQNAVRLSDGPAAPMSFANFSELIALVNGTSTQYLKTGGNAITEADLPIIATAGKVSGNAITSGTIGGSTAIVTTGNLTTSGLISSNILSTRTVSIANPTNVAIGLEAPIGASVPFTLKLPVDAGVGGQVLSTDGLGNLAWIATSGTGTVSNIATGPGLTGGPITTTGTISLADMPANTLKGNPTGSTGAATDIAISSLQGSTSSTFAAGNDARITGALPTTGGAMSGELTLASGNVGLAPVRIPAGTLVGTPASGNIESDGSNLYYTNNSPTRQKLAGFTGTPGNGQLLVGNGTGFSLANLTAGTGITITDTSGGITIATAGGGGTVTAVSSANADIAVATGNSTPLLTLNAGSTGGAGDANKIAKLDAGGKVTSAMLPDLDTAKIATGTLPVERGGTGITSYTAGDLI